MKPGLAAIIVFAASLLIYGIFRLLLNPEVAAVALATIPGLITIWLQRFNAQGDPVPSRARNSQPHFSNWQVAALYAFTVAIVWALGLMFLAAFNAGLGDLIAGGFITGSTEAFNHLQIYVIGQTVFFMWLPLLCVFGAYIGPRSKTGAYWPYIAGVVVTLVAFVLMRFAFVPGSYQETMVILNQVVNLDLGSVQGGRFFALAALIAVFVVMLLVFSVLPWLVARFRRRLTR